MIKFLSDFFYKRHAVNKKAREFLRFLGPGILVTVGFIDPGNWASNMAAGAEYGYTLLWMVSLSTIMLIVLQHNVAHLGIVTGLCLAEATAIYTNKFVSFLVLVSAVVASVATALAEILGGAIALNLLFGVHIKIGAIISALFCFFLLWSNSYQRLEKLIIGFVSLIGLSFLLQISFADISWSKAAVGWVVPSIPEGSIVIVMSVLGAVVMPHNLFLHSEVIQSRQFNLQGEGAIEKQLKYEFFDTLFSMCIGWAINSAMILMAAAVFFTHGIKVDELGQAQDMLRPILGNTAAILFAVALLFSGISSTATAGMAGGSIFAGFFKEPYNIKDSHSFIGVIITYGFALVLIFLLQEPFWGLVYSQMALSVQLPITIAIQIYLTSSKTVMGKYANSFLQKILLISIGLLVGFLNVLLLQELLGGL